MDGILNFWKPLGLTSARALEHVRDVLHQKRSGHAGSLDPLAQGVLLICCGRATKLVERIMDQPKIYRARIALDVTSDSFDFELPRRKVPVRHTPDEAQVRAALAAFEGTIEQTPPATSAVKIRGRPAYKLSRAGKAVVLTPRRVHVYWIHLHVYAWPEVDIEVACGRGTYVRALVRDLGARLGAGGCLTALTRTAVGFFCGEDAWSLDDLRAAADPAGALLSFDRAQTQLNDPASIPKRPDK